MHEELADLKVLQISQLELISLTYTVECKAMEETSDHGKSV